MMDFRVDTFLEVCKWLNYTKTAQQLHITQPAVSQHIKYLEEYYHAKFFSYEGKRLRLTGKGELFYRIASARKNDEIHLKELLASSGEEQTELKFGVTLTIGEFVIAQPLAGLLRLYPDRSVRVVTANTQTLLPMIRQGEIEFAITEGNFKKEEFESVIYSREKFIPVCARDYAFKKQVRRVEDLLSERLIVREEGSGTREVLVKDLERRNLTPADFYKTIEIGNMSAIKSLISLGCGISFLYEAAVKEELRTGQLRQIALENFEVIHDFSFVFMKNSFFREEYTTIFKQLAEDRKQ